MVRISKTINPLHFEDLEPHRFEDLVRQLIYDLKDWKMIEATGRSGSDEGFDIRAWENNYYVEEDDASEDEDSREKISRGEDKIWLIQCKREKIITPKKIKEYANEIIKKNKGNLYGIILVAPCDFSKKTRDVFIETIRGSGVQEFYLWGKAELEDMLFQPKNDHLLFAYFGISLAIRRRSLRSQIRYKLSIKRKVIKCLGDVRQNHFKPVLIRDANDVNYPYKHKIKDFDKKPKWKQYFLLGIIMME